MEDRNSPNFDTVRPTQAHSASMLINIRICMGNQQIFGCSQYISKRKNTNDFLVETSPVFNFIVPDMPATGQIRSF